MKVYQIDTNDRQMVKQFIDLPFKIYRNTPQWVPPLENDIRHMLDRQRNPYYRHSQAAFFLAVDGNGKAVGRLAVLDNQRYNSFNQEKTAFFYLFECEDDREMAQALFNEAFNWSRQRGLMQISGPKGFTALDGLGLLVKGFDHRPAFGISYNPSYYPDLIEGVGFKPDGDIVSGYISPQIQLPEKIHLLSQRVQERRGLHIKRFKTRRDLRSVVSHLKDLYNGAIVGTPGNVPFTDEEAHAMASQLLWFADPKLIKIIMKGDELAGFLFAYPDISAALQRTKGKLFPLGWIDMLLELRRTKWVNINGAGMVEKYRGLGGTAILFSEIQKSIKEGGFEHAEIVQVGVENTRMQQELDDLGIDFYKTHRLYRRML